MRNNKLLFNRFEYLGLVILCRGGYHINKRFFQAYQPNELYALLVDSQILYR